MDHEQKLYIRLKALRAALERLDVAADDVTELIDHGDYDYVPDSLTENMMDFSIIIMELANRTNRHLGSIVNNYSRVDSKDMRNFWKGVSAELKTAHSRAKNK